MILFNFFILFQEAYWRVSPKVLTKVISKLPRFIFRFFFKITVSSFSRFLFLWNSFINLLLFGRYFFRNLSSYYCIMNSLFFQRLQKKFYKVSHTTNYEKISSKKCHKTIEAILLKIFFIKILLEILCHWLNENYTILKLKFMKSFLRNLLCQQTKNKYQNHTIVTGPGRMSFTLLDCLILNTHRDFIFFSITLQLCIYDPSVEPLHCKHDFQILFFFNFSDISMGAPRALQKVREGVRRS